MQLVQLAFRNLFRNTRRTILTVLLISFSLTALIITDAMMRGMTDLIVKSITETLLGEAQIHKLGFRDNFDIDLFIDDTADLEDSLSNDPTVLAHASRTISGAMISSSYNVTGGMVYGIDADAEADLSRIKIAVESGTYLSGKPNEILIGKTMGELLEIKLGDRIVVTLTEANTGEMTQALFRVSGLLHFGITEIDKNMVFINIHEARKLIRLGEHGAHEIAIRFRNPEDAKNPDLAVFKDHNTESLESLSWLQLNKEVSSIIEMSSYGTLIIGLILFLLASLGVINSMFMSIYERIYEFGVLKAIGTRPLDLGVLIMVESLLIALISCAVGIILALLISEYTSTVGIPLGEMEFSGLAISDRILTQFHISQITELPIYVILLTMVSGLYPAWFASKIIPTEALQRSL
jgi:putative ABC transport system permease protein